MEEEIKLLPLTRRSLAAFTQWRTLPPSGRPFWARTCELHPDEVAALARLEENSVTLRECLRNRALLDSWDEHVAEVLQGLKLDRVPVHPLVALFRPRNEYEECGITAAFERAISGKALPGEVKRRLGRPPKEKEVVVEKTEEIVIPFSDFKHVGLMEPPAPLPMEEAPVKAPISFPPPPAKKREPKVLPRLRAELEKRGVDPLIYEKCPDAEGLARLLATTPSIVRGMYQRIKRELQWNTQAPVEPAPAKSEREPIGAHNVIDLNVKSAENAKTTLTEIPVGPLATLVYLALKRGLANLCGPWSGEELASALQQIAYWAMEQPEVSEQLKRWEGSADNQKR